MSEAGRTAGETPAGSVSRRIDAGEWSQALDLARRLAAGAGPLTAGQAWPATMVLYLQGDMRAAGSVYGRVPTVGDPVGDPPPEAPVPVTATGHRDPAHGVPGSVDDALPAGPRGPAHLAAGSVDDALPAGRRGPAHLAAGSVDDALLAGWAATVEWARGDVSAGRRTAARAHSLARLSGDPRALATAHTALGLLAAAEGDRRGNDRHYALALAVAVRAADPTLVLRLRANRASQRLEEGDLAGALAELAEAFDPVPAGPPPHPAMLGLAQHNRAEVLLRTGRLDAARDGFLAARATLERAGAGIVAYPLAGLGETHELRGDLPRARAAYEEAVSAARASGITHTLVPALCGLARVLVATGDVAGGRAAAGEAVAATTALTGAAAHAAAGWAVLGADPAAAREHAEQAIALARAGRNPAGLADGLELAAMTCPPAAADPLLADAARVWADIGDPVAGARVALARARIGPGRPAPAARIVAEHRLRVLGVDASTGTRSLARALRSSDSAISVRMLGSFGVLHRGELVPVTAWQSRKARDVLKLLVARRGRPITREAIGEALWPGESNVANRLSISLSVLRAVLDPARASAPDRYIVTGEAGVRYDPQALPVDVDIFLELAAAGLAAATGGRTDEARMLLAAADAAYAGDVLADEPDLAAVLALREEARTTFLAVLRALGAAHAETNDVDGAVRAWSRLLEYDPYDEDGALRLIDLLHDAGRPGEAARHHRTYAHRMRELGIPAAPPPSRRPEPAR